MKRVYVGEDLCISCGVRLSYCQQPAHSRSKDFVKESKRESLRPLLLSSNAYLGGNGK